MISEKVALAVNSRLADIFGSRWHPENGLVLIEYFENRLTDAQFIEAVRRHLLDTERGTFPPLPADIERHAQQITIEEHQRDRLVKPGHSTGPTKETIEREAAAGEVLDKLDWRGQLAFWAGERAKLNAALKQQLHLDLTRWQDREVLSHVSNIWQKGDGKADIPALVKVGAEFMDRQPNRVKPSLARHAAPRPSRIGQL